MKEEAYLSFDIEADGQSALQNSMLSIGIVLFNNKGEEVDCMEVNIQRRIGGIEDPDTMDWWKGQPEAWEYCHQNMKEPEEAMRMVGEFYKKHADNYKLKWVAGPASFDWMFLKSYYCAFAPNDLPDIGYSCNCISERKRAYIQYHKISREEFSEREKGWIKGFKLTHKGIDDARKQGLCYLGMLN